MSPREHDEQPDTVSSRGAHTVEPGWSQPSTITEAARRAFDSGVLLRALHNANAREQTFPMRIRLRGPGRDEIVDHFAAASAWTRKLRDDARDRGWRLATKTITSRTLGRQELPAVAWLDSPEITLGLLDAPTRRQAARFADLVAAARCLEATAPDTARAALVVALARPHSVLDAADDWPAALAVCAWVVEHPRPDVDVRQVPVPGVDTKLLERRRGLVSTLLDECLPEQAIDTGATTFEQRYGFVTRDRQVQLRGAGRALGVPWADHANVAWPLSILAGFDPLEAGISEVVLVENKVSFAAVPTAVGRLVLFGGGYAAEDTAAQAPWLAQVRLRYWGDIDTHGLRILARLKRSLPHVESVLMDRKTLLENRDKWGSERAQAEPEDVDTLLTRDEAELLTQLRDGTWGVGVRLEQEHIPLVDVREKLA
ncbi:Wadjet anti-phage system protein JetD domain-containing protein [Saccharothrix sp. HUAS TT1]|uniref:Wadjet anti-phage system protein JetD domain-containing protein n=1 Tax=unclassified Saccharothrix TaxID=2593673 RepID=UPI00345B86FD